MARRLEDLEKYTKDDDDKNIKVVERRKTKLLSTTFSRKGIVTLICIIFALYMTKAVYTALPKYHSTVLVTGGLGFIGSHLVEELPARDYRVIVFDDSSNGNNRVSGAQTISGDITVVNDLDRIPTENLDYVLHLAAAISVSESILDPSKYQKINVDGSINVLEWSVINGVTKAVCASSAAVYGDPPLETLPIHEEFETHPLTPYAITKLQMETRFIEYSNRGLNTVSMRFFNVYGPRQKPNSPYSGVISKFIGAIIEGKNITIFGDEKNTRDFIYVQDIARAIILAMEMETDEYELFNVGTSVQTDLNQLADKLLKISGVDDIHITYAPAREGDIIASVTSTKRIFMSLGFEPQVQIDEGLAKTYDYFLDQFETLKERSGLQFSVDRLRRLKAFRERAKR